MNIPQTIGKYRIESLIATGGMGAVYKGIHPTLNRHVILKKLTQGGSSQFTERFSREARIMMDFKHDNIVNVFDHFKEGNNYYIVQEFVDGETLESFLTRERYLPDPLALFITLEIAKALKYAHDKSVVHRDVKPANILISRNGHIKLVDFGIASSEKDAAQDLTLAGMTLGTPSYMAPEQFKDSKNVDKRADIYSLGVILYEMLTGKKPYPSSMTPEAINKIKKGKHKPPKKINPGVDRRSVSLIKKLMHPKKKRRVQDLGSIIKKLKKGYKQSSAELYFNRIAQSIAQKEITPLPEKKNFSWILPTFIFLVLGSAGFYGYSKNFHFEYFQSAAYGALKINIQLEKSYYRAPDQLFIQNKIFKETEGKLELISTKEILYSPLTGNYGPFTLLESRKIYLPPGFYRIKTMVEGDLFWNNAEIQPRNSQRLNAHTLNGYLISLKHKLPELRKFNPVISVTDQLTKKSLTDSCVIEVKEKENAQYRAYNQGEEDFETGRNYSFRIKKEGYYLKEFILKIYPDQSNLDLSVELFPMPGFFDLTVETPGTGIRLNGERDYIRGDLSRNKISIDSFQGTHQLVLSPGKYTLEFTRRNSRINKEIIIHTDKRMSGVIKYNKEKKTLESEGF